MISHKHSHPSMTRLKTLTFVWNAFFAQKQSGLKGMYGGAEDHSAVLGGKMWRAVPPLPQEETLSTQELHNLLTAKVRDIYNTSLKNSFIPTLPIYDDSFLLSCSCDQHLMCNAELLYDCNQNIFNGKITPSLNHIKIKLEDFVCNFKGIPEQKIKNKTQVVGILGDAGSGKTALMHVILKKIVEEGLYDVDFVFYIHIQDVNFKKEMSLTEFLFSSFKCDGISDQNWNQDFLNHLNKSRSAMILIDGLDGMDFEMAPLWEEEKIRSRSSQVQAHIYIKDLLTGTLLPNARIIVTARPDKYYYSFFSSNTRITMLVNILGITKDCQQKICKFLCGEFQARVFDHICNNQNASSLCFNPLFCTLISHCIYTQAKLNLEVDTFDSPTKVFVVFLELMKHSLTFTNPVMTQLCNLAWRKITNSDTFEVDGIEKKELAIACSSLEGLKIVSETSENKFMKHLMLDEFFAALKLFWLISGDELQKSVADIPCNRFQSVSKFVFGFHNSVVYRHLSKLGISSPLRNNFKDAEVLHPTKKFIKRWQGDHCSVFFSDILMLSEWVYETNDEDFAKEFDYSFRNGILVQGKIIPYDYTPLHYWFRVSKITQLEVEIGNVEFLGNSLGQLFESLLLMKEYLDVNARKVFINSWKFSDQDINVFSKYLMSTENLRIVECQATLTQILSLSMQLQHYHCLQKFDISGTVLDDEAASVLSSCIQHLNNLKKLYISSYCLSSLGLKCLCDAISCKSIPLIQLWFTRVTTRNMYFSSVACCYKKEMVDSCLTGFKKRFGLCETEDPEINLKLELLSTCLNNVKELNVDMAFSCANIDHGFQMLCNGIKELKKPLTSLTVRHVVTLGDHGCRSLSCCLHNVSSLVYNNYLDKHFTVVGVAELCHAFSHLSFPMQKFVFGCPDYMYENVVEKFNECKDKVLVLLILNSCNFVSWMLNELQK